MKWWPSFCGWGVEGMAFLLHTTYLCAFANASFFCNQPDSATAKFNNALSDNDTWRGSWNDVKSVALQWQSENATTAATFEGVNVLNLIPYDRSELSKKNEANLEKGFKKTSNIAAIYHQGAPGKSFLDKLSWTVFFRINDKYVSSDGSEVVFNAKTGAIDITGNLGTYNRTNGGIFSFFQHKRQDMDPWNNSSKRDFEKMMFAGLVYMTDENDPNIYYFVDANTGERLTRKEVRDAPATINKGFQLCWANERYQKQTMSSEEFQEFGGRAESISSEAQTIVQSAQLAATQASVGAANSSSHYCTSFTHVKTREVKVASIAAAHGNWQVYECTECHQQTGFYDKDDSIENIIAKNKQKRAIEGQCYGTAQSALQSFSTIGSIPAQ